jgi:hypothetical protein
VRWLDDRSTAAHASDTAFRFIFAVEFARRVRVRDLRVLDGEVDYAPGYIQIYCEGAAMRQLGHVEPFDRLTLFFKNMALDRPGDALKEVEAAVKAQVLERVANPDACVWSRLLSPKDLQHLFLFPGGNLDHTMLVGGQTFCDRSSPRIQRRDSTRSAGCLTCRIVVPVRIRVGPLRVRRATCARSS